MIRRFNRLLFILLVIALSLYVVILNRENITIHLSSERTLSTSAGVILIAVFCFGILCAAIVAAFFGVKSFFRERALKNREAQRELFFQELLEARSHLACGEWGKARERWERILRRDPKNIIARVELSRSLEGNGELREALKVLDGARSVDPHNAEVLFRAAEINLALGNKTVAIDNLALILYHHPVQKAALLARTLSEELDRIEDALEYHAQLERLGASVDDSELVIGRLKFRQIVRDAGSDSKGLAEKLKEFVKEYPKVSIAYEKLAQLDTEAGNVESAAQWYAKASKTDPTGIGYWRKAMELWIAQGTPERALASARSATKETKGIERIRAEFDLIRLYLSLNMFEEAKSALNNFPQLARAQQITLDGEMGQTLLSLKGLCLNNLGEHKEASEIWKKVVDLEFEFAAHPHEREVSFNGEGPSPVLSTP